MQDTAKPPDRLRDRFVEAMSRAACSVNVVTTDGPAGRGGVTVTAMSSVSADGPSPRLLICLHARGETCARVLRNGVFCVNLLRDGQQHIADIFAGRDPSGTARARRLENWRAMRTGAPRLPDPLAAFACRIEAARLVGTHYVIFGAVEDVHVADRDAALIYADRRYGHAVAQAARPAVRVSGSGTSQTTGRSAVQSTCSLNSRITRA